MWTPKYHHTVTTQLKIKKEKLLKAQLSALPWSLQRSEDTLPPLLSLQGGPTGHPTLHSPGASSSSWAHGTACSQHQPLSLPYCYPRAPQEVRSHTDFPSALALGDVLSQWCQQPLQASWAATLVQDSQSPPAPSEKWCQGARGNGQKHLFRQLLSLHSASAVFLRAVGICNLNKISVLHKGVLIIKWKNIYLNIYPGYSYGCSWKCTKKKKKTPKTPQPKQINSICFYWSSCRQKGILSYFATHYLRSLNSLLLTSGDILPLVNWWKTWVTATEVDQVIWIYATKWDRMWPLIGAFCFEYTNILCISMSDRMQNSQIFIFRCMGKKQLRAKNVKNEEIT